MRKSQELHERIFALNLVCFPEILYYFSLLQIRVQWLGKKQAIYFVLYKSGFIQKSNGDTIWAVLAWKDWEKDKEWTE